MPRESVSVEHVGRGDRTDGLNYSDPHYFQVNDGQRAFAVKLQVRQGATAPLGPLAPGDREFDASLSEVIVACGADLVRRVYVDDAGRFADAIEAGEEQALFIFGGHWTGEWLEEAFRRYFEADAPARS